MAKKNNIFGKQKEEDEKKMKMQEEDEDEDNSEDEEDDEEEDQDDDEQEDGDDDDDDGFPADYTGTSFVGFAVEKGSKGYEYEFDDDLKGDALLITQACLGPDAKKGDHAVVSMSIGENTYVVAHLSYDSLPHVSLDLAIEQDVTFTVAGDCGVHLSGRRVFDNEDEGAGYDGMDAYGDMEDEDEENEIEEDDGEDDDEDDEDEEEDDEEEEEEEVNDKKRKPEKKEENGVKKQKGQDGAAKPKQQDSSKDKPKESGKVTEDAVTKAIAEIISSAPEKKADMSRIGEALAKKFNGGFKSFGLPQKSCKQFIEANKKFQIVGNDVKLA